MLITSHSLLFPLNFNPLKKEFAPASASAVNPDSCRGRQNVNVSAIWRALDVVLSTAYLTRDRQPCRENTARDLTPSSI